MGIVWKGFDTELNRPVAIKVLARHLAHSGAARQRFAREARAAAAVVHEHVVAIHNVETDREIPFLVMQYVAGESLQARVDRVGPLSVKEVLRISLQAAAGLASAHGQGLIHRDVKPANILLEHGVDRALLTDFGLARTVDDASLTTTGVLTGTPHYMSPEQAGGDATDQRTDLFSLGAVIYFMATGRPPFRAEKAMGVLHRICHERHRPLWELNADIPDELSDIVDHLLEKQPNRRLGSAQVLEVQLRQILARLQNHKARPKWLRRLRHGRRHPWLLPISSVIVLALIGMVLVVPPLLARLRPPIAKPTDQVSLQTLQMASLSEQEGFQRQLDDLQEQFSQFEMGLRQSTFASSRDDPWQTDMATMQGLLFRSMRGLVTLETSTPQPKGEN
jgi:serine/threonine protein kinase